MSKRKLNPSGPIPLDILPEEKEYLRKQKEKEEKEKLNKEFRDIVNKG